MILWYFLGYLVLGLVLIYGAAIIHIIRGELIGYAVIDYWTKHGEDVRDLVTGEAYILGLLIWPERFIYIVCNMIPQFYELYDLKEEL